MTAPAVGGQTPPMSRLPIRPPLTRLPRSGPLPVSHTQRERLLTGRDVYLPNNTVIVAFRFDGPLDAEVLARAVNAMPARHEAMRVVFPTDFRADLIEPDGEHMRVVEADGADPFGAGLELLSADAQKPFDLARGPLFRCLLVRVDENTHLLGVAIDHIIADGWSCNLLARDILATYEALWHGEQPELPPLTMQHLDFVSWENTYLSGETRGRLLDYWRTALAGVDPIPESGLADPAASTDPAASPADSAANDAGPARLERVRLPLGDGFRPRLRGFAAARRTTPYAVFSAALAAAVRGQQHADGGPVADHPAFFMSLSNRVHAAVQNAFGYFATPGALQADLSGDPGFGELVSRQAQTVAGAIRHQELPHALILQELSPQLYGCRYRGDPTLVPRYLNFDLAQHRARPFGFGVRGVKASMISVPRPDTPRGGLRLLVYELETAAELELRYRTDGYGRPWAQRFLNRMRHILHTGVSDPETPLSHVAAAADSDGEQRGQS